MKKFYVKDCPDNMAVHDWILKSTDLDYYIKNMKPKFKSNGVVKFRNSLIDLVETEKTVSDAFKKFGWFGFLNILGNEAFRSPTYGGLSLVYNSDYKQKEQVPPVCQTLGYPRINAKSEFIIENPELNTRIMLAKADKTLWKKIGERGLHGGFDFLCKEAEVITEQECTDLKQRYSDQKDKSVKLYDRKNTYNDSWSFNQPTEVMNYEYLEHIAGLFKRSFIRSRLASFKNIDSTEIKEGVNQYMWHRDDTMFVEARINMVVTAPEDAFGIEIEDIGKYYYKPGDWITWDTGLTHRPFVDKPGLERSSLVYAVSPWFDYIKEEDVWIKNEFYGNKHPLDMFVEGDIITGLTVDNQLK